MAVRLESAAEHLSQAIRFRTVSREDAARVDVAEFRAFHDFLEKTYPLIHSRLAREVVGGSSLLYRWEGTDGDGEPVVLAAHIDVVPIEEGTTEDWTHPPFDGAVSDGYIWGRGTMDCKGLLIAIMEAVEGLLAAGYEPRRSVHLAFGADEEVGGWNGAMEIAALLASRGVRAFYVLDEGGAVVDGKALGMGRPLAAVGVREKGYVTLELKAQTEGGHSSMPSRHTAIGILASAIHRLERHPFPARLPATTREMLRHLRPEMPLPARIALRLLGALQAPVKLFMSRAQATDAMIRTTIATTIVRGGDKANVLPQEATAAVNFRLLPGDGIDYVMRRVERVIKEKQVSVRKIGRGNEATPASKLDSRGFDILQRTIGEVFPTALVAPVLVVGRTDARHYHSVSDCVFRFAPMRVSDEDRDRPHGTDERISVENFGDFIRFYTRMIERSD